jgi:hypothetical protein
MLERGFMPIYNKYLTISVIEERVTKDKEQKENCSHWLFMAMARSNTYKIHTRQVVSEWDC